MKTVFQVLALGVATAGLSVPAFAQEATDMSAMTCAEFSAMDSAGMTSTVQAMVMAMDDSAAKSDDDVEGSTESGETSTGTTADAATDATTTSDDDAEGATVSGETSTGTVVDPAADPAAKSDDDAEMAGTADTDAAAEMKDEDRVAMIMTACESQPDMLVTDAMAPKE